MKTIVVNENEQTRVPFLRGILVRSLLDAGLEFEDALGLASQMRDELSDRDEVTSELIRDRVFNLLEESGHLGAMEPYRLPLVAPIRIQVRRRDGTETAFSRNRHELFLQATGMKQEKAEQITDLLFDRLLGLGVNTLSSQGLAYLTYLCLQQEVSKKAARRYLVWYEYVESERPLVLMICGTVGTGKSTVATEVGHVLGIVRIQSTDMLREVMRMMMPKKLAPVLHTSSFNAWRALPIQDSKERDRDQLVADGFRSQARLLAVPCEAVMQRAEEESVPVIIEGVHALPELMQHLPEESDAIAVHVTLAVLKAKVLKARLKGRGKEVPQRRAKRYLNRFDAIWSLQSFLLSESDRCDVPIITNQDKEKSVQQVIQQVNYELSRHYAGLPRDVFGEVVDRVNRETTEQTWQEAVELLAE